MGLKTYKSDILNSQKVTHGFFTRLGGVSVGIYEGLNMGLGSDDQKDSVLKNRQLVTQNLGVGPNNLLTLYQVHSSDVVTVNSPWESGNNPKADAMVTNLNGLALGILTADCVPVLFADQKNGVIGAAHAGWKGALKGVITNTINAMCQLGAQTNSISACVGPAIQQASYEVGSEVRQNFIDSNQAYEKYFKKNQKNNYQFDLCGLVTGQLKGLNIESLEHISEDTYQNEVEFYSFRRATHKKESDYGRQISAICLKAN